MRKVALLITIVLCAFGDALQEIEAPNANVQSHMNITSESVSDGESLNADCLVYFDVLKNSVCKEYYRRIGSNEIDKLKSDEETFESCLVSNCGAYPTEQTPKEITYPFIMEKIKGCTLLDEKTLSGDELPIGYWFVDAGKSYPATDKNAKQPKIVPYKLLQYRCPSAKEEICVYKERMLQNPVLCFKENVTPQTREKLLKCFEHGDAQACKLVQSTGGVGRYIFWQYCDEDRDGDGYPESLSLERQRLCNRSDASTLKCSKDTICTIELSCKEPSTITKETSEYRSCKNISRNFEEHVVDTKCGDQSDIYRDDPNCVRINSLTDAYSSEGKIRLRFANGSGYKTDDYTEFVLYKKLQNFKHQALLAALFFPNSMENTKKGYSLFGINVTEIAKFFGAKVKWKEDGLATILDNLYQITNEYCKKGKVPSQQIPSAQERPECEACEEIGMQECQYHAKKHICMAKYESQRQACFARNNCRQYVEGSLEEAGDSGEGSLCTIKHKTETKCWSWKKGKIIKKKYTKCVMQSAIWTEPFVSNMNVTDFVWKRNGSKTNRYMPLKILYSFDLQIDPSDIVMIYNTNTRKNEEAYIATRINTYQNLQDCGTPFNTTSGFNQLKTILKPVAPIAAPESDIHDVAMILPHAGVYTIDLYDNDTFLYHIVYYFPMNNGSNYPLTTLDLLRSNFDSSLFEEEFQRRINEEIERLSQNALNRQSVLLQEIASKLTEVARDANIYRLSDNKELEYILDERTSGLYNLLELEHYQNLASSGQINIPTVDNYNTSNYPGNIDPTLLESLDVPSLKGAPYSFQSSRQGEYSYLRFQSDFINSVKLRYLTLMWDFVGFRYRRLLYYTNLVYDDYQKVRDFVESVLNKNPYRYQTTVLRNFYHASFKSKCGDFAYALRNVENNYLNQTNFFTRSYFSQELTNIKEGVKKIILNHMKEISILYGYLEYVKEGTSQYDAFHASVPGYYSCLYDCKVVCKSKFDCRPECQRESGRCYTEGETGVNCKGECQGYVPAHWGSGLDKNGDAPNDWDKKCEGVYHWFETQYRFSNQDRVIKGVRSGYFDSWGGYACDRLYLTANGDEHSKCVYNKHDQKDKYEITTFLRFWRSKAMQLDTNPANVSREITNWMEYKHFKDSYDKSPALIGIDNVKYELATDIENGINQTADSETRNYILNRLRSILKSIYLQYYHYLVNTGQSSVDPDLNQAIKKLYDELYASYVESHFKKFNRIIIKDAEIDPNNPNSVNYDIKLPGSHYVKYPRSFSVTIVPHQESRKYRCYTDWDRCNLPSGCEVVEEKFTNYITDIDGKRVPVLKDVTYKCSKEVQVGGCDELAAKQKCSNYNLLQGIDVDFDSADFSKDFYSGIGRALALNDAVKIFGGQKLRCEDGLFTDFSWLQDPFFWIQAFRVGLDRLFPGMANFKEGMKAWADLSVEGSNVASDTSQCAQEFAQCLIDAGYTPTSFASQMFNTDRQSAQSYYQSFKNTEGACANAAALESPVGQINGGCAEWAQSFAMSNSALEEKLADQLTPLAHQLGFSSGQELMEFLQDPMTGLVLNIVWNLAFNTFDDCNQCREKKCAESHEPKEAVRLLKLTNAIDDSTKFEGLEYGLAPGFVAYNNCFKKGQGCALKIFGKCLRKYHEFCCYNGRVARILVGQMYQQLGYNFNRDGCNALKLSDLYLVDFTPCAPNTAPSPNNKCINYEEFKNYILSKINWDTQKSINLNGVIQSIISSVDSYE